MQGNNSFRRFQKILKPIKSVEDFVNTDFNTLIQELNDSLQGLSLSSNFNSQVFENIEIGATTTLRVFHKLKIDPKFRIILRQSGGGLITDGEFTKDYVELYNSGASTATISFILLKE